MKVKNNFMGNARKPHSVRVGARAAGSPAFVVLCAFISISLGDLAAAEQAQANAIREGSVAAAEMKVLNIWADENGVSHFREVSISLQPFVAGGSISEPFPAGSVWYRIAPHDQDADFHRAPRRQLVVTLQGGTVEFTTSDGESRLVRPGEIVLVEDTTGQGHRTRTVDGLDRIGLFISLE